MSDNHLHELFINDVKGSLGRGGGGSASFDPSKHKLSEFENDLWYTKKEAVITLTKEDFTETTVNDITVMYYKGSPKLSWLTGLDVVDWDIHATNPDTGESDVFNKEFAMATDQTKFEVISPDAGILFCVGDGLMVATGFDFFNSTEFVPEDAFYVIAFSELLDTITGDIVFYKVTNKKVPIEYCDTSEIEAEINTLTEEVENS